MQPPGANAGTGLSGSFAMGGLGGPSGSPRHPAAAAATAAGGMLAVRSFAGLDLLGRTNSQITRVGRWVGHGRGPQECMWALGPVWA